MGQGGLVCPLDLHSSLAGENAWRVAKAGKEPSDELLTKGSTLCGVVRSTRNSELTNVGRPGATHPHQGSI